MKLEHRLQILIAVLSMLGTFLLGTGQNNATLPLDADRAIEDIRLLRQSP